MVYKNNKTSKKLFKNKYYLLKKQQLKIQLNYKYICH